jgi:alpha-mannosidase
MNFNYAPIVRALSGAGAAAAAAVSIASMFQLDRAGVTLEAVKLAEDTDNEIVLRLYEVRD